MVLRRKVEPKIVGPVTKVLTELNEWSKKEIEDFRRTLNCESIAYWDGEHPIRMSEAKKIEEENKRFRKSKRYRS